MKIRSNIKDYGVRFTNDFGFVNDLKFDNRYVVIDRIIYEMYGKVLGDLLQEGNHFIMDVKEENKTLQTATEIIDRMTELRSRRNTKLIAIGGGIVQDVSCFVATVLYRGIDWYLVPTTLLAQTDSCIGSKSSINYCDKKNLLGTFYPPTEILIDPGFLETLSSRDYYSGLGEILKCAIMQGRSVYSEMKGNIGKVLNGDRGTLLHEIERTLRFKKSVIEMDEFDRDIRNIMNYGHTFGHAIESATQYAIPHGQAVSIGIAIANEISVKRGLLSIEYADDIFKTVKNITDIKSLPSSESVLYFMRSDKKYKGGKHTCILLYGDHVEKVDDVDDKEILEAVIRILGKI
jgi:3-dehydroquinate synthase